MPDNNIDDETKEIIDSFVSEGMDLIEDAEKKISNFEEVNNSEIVNTIFRMFHSIKGSAGFLNFKNIHSVTHEAETLLDFFRKNEIKPNQETIELLYKTLDFIHQLIINVENELTDIGFEENSSIIVHDISECIKNLKYDMKKEKNDDQTSFITELNNESEKEINSNFITQEMTENFYSESIDIFDKIENSLLKLEKKKEDLELLSEIFRQIHTLKGNCGIFGLSKMEEECIKIESFLDEIRNGKKKLSQDSITLLLHKIDNMRQNIKSDKDSSKKSVNESDDEFDEIKPLGEILIEMGAVKKESIDKALNLQKKIKPKPVETFDGEFKRKDIRVNTNKLDLLLDTVGELVTASSMVINNPDLHDLKLENFRKSSNALSKIVKDLHELSMSIRMVPLESLFIKMKRLVRDLSRKSNKKINFEIYGQDTETDRTVIEQISDPLVHIIRNSIDHGIENSEIREQNNKPGIGKITLGAKYEGNEIWIIVEDDGKGLDRNAILKKAMEKGIVLQDTEKLSDEEVWNLIFHAGLSTAESVSDISGRGVGMDVVKRNLEKLRGNIEVVSKKNKGAKIILKIPLTLAIMEGITVKIGNSLFSIPTVDIQEFIEVKKSQIIKTEANNFSIFLRGEIIPLLKLYQIFNLKKFTPDLLDKGIIIIVNSNTKKACIHVDKVVGNHQIVVKSLSDYLGEITGVSGCTIMSNGDVSMILDIKGIIHKCLY